MASSKTSTPSSNGLSGYLRSSIAELKKVTWPTREETWQKVGIVIAFSVVFAIFLGSVDFALTRLIQLIIR